MSYAIYAGIQRANESARDLEFRAISHITRQMTEANRPGADPVARIRALNGNIRLWSLLMADLAGPDNALPEVIRGNYIALGRFARRASVAALPDNSSLDTLISINTDVLDALSRQRADAS